MHFGSSDFADHIGRQKVLSHNRPLRLLAKASVSLLLFHSFTLLCQVLLLLVIKKVLINLIIAPIRVIQVFLPHWLYFIEVHFVVIYVFFYLRDVFLNLTGGLRRILSLLACILVNQVILSQNLLGVFEGFFHFLHDFVRVGVEDCLSLENVVFVTEVV